MANYPPDAAGGSVTELDAATGALVKVLKGRSYGFTRPVAITSNGAHVWVANGQAPPAQ